MGMGLEFNEQWQAIMEDGQFSEEVTFEISTAQKFAVSGIVYSGTYTIDDAARYTVRKGISQTYFQCSKLSIASRFPEGNPEVAMKGKVIVARGKRYKVNDAYGLDGGMLTFLLVPAKEATA